MFVHIFKLKRIYFEEHILLNSVLKKNRNYAISKIQYER